MNNKEYSRDKRSPKPYSEQTSKTMSKIKAKNTKPEIKLRKALWNSGIRGYRVAPKNIPGKPDICFIGKKIAIFMNGCYWHRCPTCNLKLPKNNSEFWENKFSKNIARDIRKKNDLENLGYNVITVWECELKKDKFGQAVLNIIEQISINKNSFK